MKSRFDWRGTYFNLVSFVAIVVLLVAVIIAGNNILQIAMPQMSLSQHEWRQVESFEAFKRFHPREPTRIRPKSPPETVDTLSSATEEDTEAELRAEWQEQRTLLVEGQKRRGLWSLLQAIVTIIVVFPVFWWHRRKAKELKVNGLVDEGQGG
ncbi:MAG: hypothetical protein GF341_05745 [candidate division Zixibacteria bacterium]|nr:hypothetical protein [candidate division Zixibacteria bacterium]